MKLTVEANIDVSLAEKLTLLENTFLMNNLENNSFKEADKAQLLIVQTLMHVQYLL